MVGQEGVFRTLIFAGHHFVVFGFAGPFFLSRQLAPLGHRNVDGIIVVVAVDLSVRMVAVATWHSIAVAAGTALVIAASVLRISHVGCVAPALTIAWLGTSFAVPRILGTLLPGVPGWRSSGRQVERAWLAAIALAAGARRLPAAGMTGATTAAIVIAPA